MRRDEKNALHVMLVTSLFAVLIAAAAMMAGCYSVVVPSDRDYFDLSADNARAMNRAVQADANLPPYLRKWVNDESGCRQIEAAWAHGKAALASRPAQ